MCRSVSRRGGGRHGGSQAAAHQWRGRVAKHPGRGGAAHRGGTPGGRVLLHPAPKVPQEPGAVPGGAPLWVHQGEPHQGELGLSVLRTLGQRGLGLPLREPLREKQKLWTLLLRPRREPRRGGDRKHEPVSRCESGSHGRDLPEITPNSRAGPGHTQHWRTVWAQRSASLCPWDPSRALLQPHALTGSFLGPAGGLRSRLLVLGLYTHHLM